ncbi:Endo-1,4-beta-xylanase [Venustampulla echinocandica]|uniref:Endo-1,4-beta-xylanase n=1 Tax=Venustampulla echinocandica TaxID=2656787 RepID=A0A370TTS9_9HELO|nr:Endo-1,4-beta-xylanase [Venustampulla echinocandica]RDL38914.1 Endo-1,4-beta-xylanase [Venustampulla echinocandica]
MVSFSFLLVAAASLVPGALAAPGEQLEHGSTTSSRDIQAANYFSNWSEGGSNVRCNRGSGGSYSVTWSGQGGFVCGTGYNPGGSRTVKYSGSYNATGPGYLAWYGWTRNPLIEYYIIESYDILAPGEPWTKKGSFTFEEGTYDLYTSTRNNKPSIEGTRTFQQYWSVRTEHRVGGTITTGRHFTEWANVGLRLGNHDYAILATEGFVNGTKTSAGTANINVE